MSDLLAQMHPLLLPSAERTLRVDSVLRESYSLKMHLVQQLNVLQDPKSALHSSPPELDSDRAVQSRGVALRSIEHQFVDESDPESQSPSKRV